jgi:hypothetical protein
MSCDITISLKHTTRRPILEKRDTPPTLSLSLSPLLSLSKIVKHSAKVVSPSSGVNLFNSLAVSVFRYSAALIPWGRHDLGVDTLPAQLDKLGHLWCQGFNSAWDLPAGTAHDRFTFTIEQGGMGYLQPVEVMAEVILQHIQKDLLHDDVMRDILLLELQ